MNTSLLQTRKPTAAVTSVTLLNPRACHIKGFGHGDFRSSLCHYSSSLSLNKLKAAHGPRDQPCPTELGVQGFRLSEMEEG